MSPVEVPQSRLRSPFHERLVAADTLNRWHDWQGYTVPDALYDAATEYFAIRNATAVFDLTPMRKYAIRGTDALDFLDRLVTRDMRRIGAGRVAYAVWCDERGQVLDDGTIFHLRPGEYRLCAQERSFDWLTDGAFGLDVQIDDETDAVAALAVQGPTSFSVLSAMGLEGIGKLKPFDLARLPFDGAELTVSRTGYTGDLGYELWIDPSRAAALWDRLFAAGRVHGIRAIGSEALNLARIEAGFLLAGTDFVPASMSLRPGRTRSPFELGLGRLVDLDKPVFNGRRALADERRKGSRWRLVRLDVEGNKPAQNAYLYSKRRRNRREIGFVTSAAWSPVCKQNVALGTVDARYGRPGETLWAEIYYRRELHWTRVMAAARVVDSPFWSPPRRSATPPAPC